MGEVEEGGRGRKRREEAVRRFSILLVLLFCPSLFFRCLMNVVCKGIKKGLLRDRERTRITTRCVDFFSEGVLRSVIEGPPGDKGLVVPEVSLQPANPSTNSKRRLPSSMGSLFPYRLVRILFAFFSFDFDARHQTNTNVPRKNILPRDGTHC